MPLTYFNVTSGLIGSGQIGSPHIASGGVLSGNIASGQIGQMHLSSGLINSGQIGNNAVVSGSVASGQLSTYNFASGATINRAIFLGPFISGTAFTAITEEIISGGVAVALSQSGNIRVAMASVSGRMPAIGFVGENVASGIQVNVLVNGVYQFSSGLANYSGYVGRTLSVGRSGQIVSTSGSWNSGGFISGDIYQPIGTILNSGGFVINLDPPAVSGAAGGTTLTSGIVTSGFIGNNAVVSGNIASGQIGQYHFQSGTTVRFVSPIMSGNTTSVITEEAISGIRAVSISQSGYLRIAMAAVSGRMPAMGVVVDNVASGIQVNVYSQGLFQSTASGLADYSGYVGSQLFVGRSGQIVTSSGSFGSGGFLSGDILQSIGNAINSGALNIIVGDPFAEGVLASGIIVSGNIGDNAVVAGSIASGAVSQFKLASGAVNSGHVASGAVVGQAGGGAFNIASGSIGTFDIGSGAIVSGRIASGQIGGAHIGFGMVHGVLGSWDNIASGTIGSLDIGSGQILSGNIASGQIGNSHLAATSVHSGHVGSGAIMGQIGAGAFNIASGTIGSLDIGSGQILSGNIASGQIGNFHISSGAITSGDIGNNAVVSGNIASGQLSTYNFASGATINRAIFTGPFVSGTAFTAITEELISGGMAVTLSQSGNIRVAMASVSGRMPAIGIVAENVASGIQVNVLTHGIYQFSSGLADYSGYIGRTLLVGRSGQIVTASGSFNSGGLSATDAYQPIGVALNSGGYIINLDPPAISGSATGGSLASGSVQSGHIGNAAVVSGSIASGQISFYHLQSGFSIEYLSPLISGDASAIIAAENISGVRAVSISSSGYLQIAMAGNNTRMPAMGVVVNNVASGIQTNVFTHGFFQLSSGMADYSGYLGQTAFVGRSGQIVTTSGSFNSGGFLGGDQIQAIGIIVNSGGFIASPEDNYSSGFILSGFIASGQIGSFHIGSGAIISGRIASGVIGTNHIASGGVLSGNIASGQIGNTHLAATTIRSGHVGSGAITGRAGGGAFNIASGSIANFDIASGGVLSGNIASGQIGFAHLAITSVLSGTIGSGQLGTNHFASGTTIRFVSPIVSGTAATAIITEEAISGYRAVNVSQSGRLRIAMASVSGRMPAVGVVVDNVASGIQVNVYTEGVFQLTSGMANYSGYVGNQIYVGRSGQLVQTSGSWNSGGLLSGDIIQTIGNSTNSGAMQIVVGDAFRLGLLASGVVTSGAFGSDINFRGYPKSRRTVLIGTAFGTVSGVRAVVINSSGLIEIARGTSGYQPPIGVYDGSGVTSGQEIEVVLTGIVQAASGITNTRLGKAVYSNASGIIGNMSGSFLSGGFGTTAALSGSLCVQLGYALTADTIFLTTPVVASGFIDFNNTFA